MGVTTDPVFFGLQSWLNTPENEEQVFFYEAEHYYLSNFSAFAIRFNGLLWMTAEHLYQAHKFFWLKDGKIADMIFHAPSAHEAKQIAKAHKDKIFPEFEQVKLVIMEAILRAKIEQHSYVLKMLLKTSDAILIEDSSKDAFWGRGPDFQGMNHLGRIWMKLRAEKMILFPQEKQGGC